MAWPEAGQRGLIAAAVRGTLRLQAVGPSHLRRLSAPSPAARAAGPVGLTTPSTEPRACGPMGWKGADVPPDLCPPISAGMSTLFPVSSLGHSVLIPALIGG